jgi:hypothetical protein
MSTEQTLIWVANVRQDLLDAGVVQCINGIVQHTPHAIAGRSEESEIGVVGIYKREGDTEFRLISRTSFLDLSSAHCRAICPVPKPQPG